MGNKMATGRTKLRHKLRDTLLLRRPVILPEAERKKLQRALLAVKSKLRIDTEGHYFQDHYVVLKNLGGGAFGKVYKVVHKETGMEYACKVISAEDQVDAQGGPNDYSHHHQHWRLAVNEIDVISKLNHPNIVKMKECFVEEGRVYLVMELLTGGDLLETLADMGTYREHEAILVFRQVVESLKYMHDMGVVHCDVKLENIMLRSPGELEAIKLIDFGMAIRHGAHMPSESLLMGTPLYMAPEVVKGSKDAFSPPSDMWSCGVLLHILLTGEPPYIADSPEELYETLKRTKSFESTSDDLSDHARDLINKLLVKRPRKRLTAAQVLQHPWFRSATTGRELLAAVSRLQTLRLERDNLGFERQLTAEADAVWTALSL